MKILVSNDDGIAARGIRVLAEHLAQHPENDVYVVAPDRERSATGHALTLHKPIRVEELKLAPSLKGSWSVTGTPSDCIKFAVGALLQEPPDLVISGINNGPNMGSDVLYSGTVSAAMEGAILNIPSIAVSLAGNHGRHFQVAAEFVARLVQVLPEAQLSGGTLLNVNVPNLPESQIKGVKLTDLSIRIYNDHYEKRVDPRGKIYYWLAGEAQEGNEPENSDAWAISKGYISITPISFNMTDRQTLVKLKDWAPLQSLIRPSSQAEPLTVESAG